VAGSLSDARSDSGAATWKGGSSRSAALEFITSKEMIMTRNMGTADRALRIGFAVVVVALWVTGAIGGTIALILGVVAVAFILTSAVGWCPLYAPFGLSTCGRSAKA